MALEETFFASARHFSVESSGPVAATLHPSQGIPLIYSIPAEALYLPPRDSHLHHSTGTAKDIAQKMSRAFEEITLSGQIIGRQEVLFQTLLAMLCREHQLLISPAGTAKTLLSESICSRIAGVNRFSIQMTKSSSEEELIGPLDLEEFRRSRYRHLTRGTMVDAHIAFIDEIFNASHSTLPVLNSLLNERKLRKGGHGERCNLRTAIATTNFLELNENIEPVLDRFLMQAQVQEARTVLEQTAILEAHQKYHGRVSPAPPQQLITLAEWDRASDVALGLSSDEVVVVPRWLLFACALIKRQIDTLCPERLERSSQGLTPCTDRRAAKSIDCIRAHTLLNGRSEATTDDLRAMVYVFAIIGRNPTIEQSVRDIIQSVGKEASRDREEIEQYLSLSDLIRTRVHDHHCGRGTEASWWQSLLNWLKIRTTGEIQLQDIRTRMREVNIASQGKGTLSLRESVMCELDRAIKTIDTGDSSTR